MNIVEISRRLDEGKQPNNKEFNWKPTKLEKYDLPPFCIPTSNGKGFTTKRNRQLSKVLLFIDRIKHIRYSSGCTIMPISSTSRELIGIWGSDRNVQNAIAFMKKIGLIEIYSSEYQFNAYYSSDNRSKLYKYFVENEILLKNYCSNNGIEKYSAKNYSKNSGKKISGIQFQTSEVLFSNELKLPKPDNVSMAEFEDYLMYCLKKNYDELAFMQMKIDEINELYYKNYPEFEIRFVPHFKWDHKKKNVTGIGIRATNKMCNIPKEERKEVLNKYGLHLCKDIKSSVGKLTLSINEGRWVGEDVDIYKLIYDELDLEEPFENVREAVKKVFMRAYFDSSDLLTAHHTWRSMNQIGANKKDVYDEMVKYKKAMLKAVGGKTYGNEIFYVESCVYVMTLYDLLTSYHKLVWLVYDCFYSTGPENTEEFVFLISTGVMLNFNEFIKKYSKQGVIDINYLDRMIDN